jgi:hypothetical protein
VPCDCSACDTESVFLPCTALACSLSAADLARCHCLTHAQEQQQERRQPVVARVLLRALAVPGQGALRRRPPGRRLPGQRPHSESQQAGSNNKQHAHGSSAAAAATPKMQPQKQRLTWPDSSWNGGNSGHRRGRRSGRWHGRWPRHGTKSSRRLGLIQAFACEVVHPAQQLSPPRQLGGPAAACWPAATRGAARAPTDSPHVACERS